MAWIRGCERGGGDGVVTALALVIGALSARYSGDLVVRQATSAEAWTSPREAGRIKCRGDVGRGRVTADRGVRGVELGRGHLGCQEFGRAWFRSGHFGAAVAAAITVRRFGGGCFGAGGWWWR